MAARAQCAPATIALQQPTASWSQPCGGSFRPGNVSDTDPLTAWALGRCNGAPDETLTESLVFETATDRIVLRPTGAFGTLDEIRDLAIRANGRVFRLGDVANVTRGYVDPPQQKMRVGGREALGVGVTMAAGGDVIHLGRDLDAQVERTRLRPLPGRRGGHPDRPGPHHSEGGAYQPAPGGGDVRGHQSQPQWCHLLARICARRSASRDRTTLWGYGTT
mgnify:CR=1 FL=1